MADTDGRKAYKRPGAIILRYCSRRSDRTSLSNPGRPLFCSGCGVGYFSLKLAPKVAEHGTVLAEDILGESLTFLWIRTFLQHQSNIRVIHGNPDDPHLPQGSVDAVLIANSYHEFTKPLAILDHTFRALRSDGRLVVLDRGPRSYHGESREVQMQQYQIDVSIAEDEIRQRGFEIISRDNRFIDRPAAERPAG